MALNLLGGLLLGSLGKYGLDEYYAYQNQNAKDQKGSLIDQNIGSMGWQQQGPMQPGQQRQQIGQSGLLGNVEQQTDAVGNLLAGGVKPQEITSLLTPKLQDQANKASMTQAEQDMTKHFMEQGNKLRTERAKQLQGFNEARTAYQTTITALQSDTGAGSLAAIFSFMKALDPRSVVRSEEQDAAQRTGGPVDSLVGMVNSLKGKSTLGPEARRGIAEVMTNIMNGRLDQANAIAKQYDLIATEQNVPLSQIRTGTFNNQPMQVPQGLGGRPPPATRSASEEAELQYLKEKQRRESMRGTIIR